MPLYTAHGGAVRGGGVLSAVPVLFGSVVIARKVTGVLRILPINPVVPCQYLLHCPKVNSQFFGNHPLDESFFPHVDNRRRHLSTQTTPPFGVEEWL